MSGIAFAGLTVVSLVGCTSLDEEESEMLRLSSGLSSVEMLDAGVLHPGGDGGSSWDASDDGGAQVRGARPNRPAGYFVSAKLNGTGCPVGTADASISLDGKKLLVHFTSFEAAVGENKSVDVKNCQLGIKFQSTQGFSFGLADFRFQGYAYLSKGQSSMQLVKYYFQGEPVKNQRQQRTDLVGPYDDTYIFEDEVGPVDTVWSPCGTERDLHVNVTLRLDGKSYKKDGYINVRTATGFGFSFRPCRG